MGNIAILGAGVMGSTLCAALVRAGSDPQTLVVSDRDVARASELADRDGVRAAAADRAVADSDVVLLAVKPQDMEALLAQVRDHLAPGTVLISIAAGITTASIERRIGQELPVVRAMPNTPALVDQGMTALSPGLHCAPEHLARAEEVMGLCGRTLVLDEGHLDAVTAISGSGPSYIFYVVEAMIEAGVLLGLPRSTSTELVVQTLYGAATMIRETGTHPTVLREQVSSPGGTSVAALRELEHHKVRAAFLSAMEAAARRSGELASGNA